MPYYSRSACATVSRKKAKSLATRNLWSDRWVPVAAIQRAPLSEFSAYCFTSASRVLQVSAHPEAPQRPNEFGQLAQALKEMEREIPVHEIQSDLDFIGSSGFWTNFLTVKLKQERMEYTICRGGEGRLPGRIGVLQLRLG
jgi:hypothetical protein